MDPSTNWLIILIPVAYLLGAIPFGLIVGLAKGVDPRKAGSGNIGATNVGRLLGGRYFVIVFSLDLLKGLLPTLAAAWILHVAWITHHKPPTARDYILWLLVGFAAILGHIFSIFLGFKGGKGVATATGVALGVFPYFTLPLIIAATAFFAVFKLTRIVSLASICAALVMPLAYIAIGWAMGWSVFGSQLPLLIFATLIAAMIIYRHRSNIARLRAGTESRFETKRNER
ncbi:glycerol-3-phosphate 1-O-acyltransferase PlsY [Fontivita pretiosa]|uniref:glycerol-3-phosphate 1-O-acyltransferase PlsY n=1 Tax=Fontivita pretiosa TaxID=2989684 RepID=UPI003D16F71B